jgi:hypothetical protein
MSQVQKGHCAFSQSCINTHATHVQVAVNRVMCAPHARLADLPSSSESNGTEFSATAFRPAHGLRQRRSRWATYVGIATGGLL